METKKTNKNWKDAIKRALFKNKYHFGNVDLTNPTKNHYTIGFFPATRVHGQKAEGKIRTIGISSRFYADSEMEIEDNASYGLVWNVNKYEDGCKIGKNKVVGVMFNNNKYEVNCKAKRSMAIGLIGNNNEYKNNCEVRQNIAIGILNANEYGDSCKIEESSKAIGLLNFHVENDKTKFGLLEKSVINKD